MNDALVGAIKSKTMWFNAAITVLGLVDWISGHSGLIAAVLPVAVPYLAIVGPIGMILRMVTNQPLAEKAQPASPFGPQS